VLWLEAADLTQEVLPLLCYRRVVAYCQESRNRRAAAILSEHDIAANRCKVRCCAEAVPHVVKVPAVDRLFLVSAAAFVDTSDKSNRRHVIMWAKQTP
jgi:hypothetical protein